MRRTKTLLLLAGLAAVGCSQRAPAKPAAKAVPKPVLTAPVTSPALQAKLPRDNGPFFPSLARVEGDGPIDAAALADVEACAGCHQEAAREWSASAHAHASFDNPWYRASVDSLRREVGFEASRHCGGCHDPVLLLAGAMDHEVKPEDPRVAVGVTCLVCHSVRAATSDGNASYVLTNAPVPYPEPGNPESLQRHRERLAAKPLRTPALCVSCHRGFLGRHTGISHHLSGMDDPGAWRGSAFAGTRSNTPEPVAAQTCAECHMRPEPVRFEEAAAKDGKIRSHRFAGAHTPFAAMSGDPRQLEVLEQQLRGGIVLDAPVVWRNGEAQLSSELKGVAPGDRLAVDVTVRNLAVGHSFPGGVKDMQDTWVELRVRDARGQEIARAGTRHARDEDDTAFVMRALQVDADGRPETRHEVTRFGTVAYDHTVPPLGARAVRYSFRVPQGSVGPLRVQAKVMHRRHRKEAREFACEATRSERGRAFVSAAPKRLDPFFDGCRQEPVTEVANLDLTLGSDDAERPSWERLYDHALGLSLSIQEDLGEAKQSGERALREFENSGGSDVQQHAKLLTLLGRIDARQGRLAEALAYADRAQALLGEHPAVERVRADAYAQVWRWKDAAAALAVCTKLAPGDTAAFRDLAKARFSAGDPRGALEAAHSGLALQPRDEGLLRVQALALESEGSPVAKMARDAFLYYREADETTSARMACDRNVKNCLRDRDPVVKIDLDPKPVLTRTVR